MATGGVSSRFALIGVRGEPVAIEGSEWVSSVNVGLLPLIVAFFKVLPRRNLDFQVIVVGLRGKGCVPMPEPTKGGSRGDDWTWLW
jgi:hypothetical protein